MRFLDEKDLWQSDVEALVERLSNKTSKEVYDELMYHDIIRLRSTKRPNSTVFNRFMLVLLVIPMYILCGVKWCFTGNIYLDSWEKKYKIVEFLVKIMGIRNGEY